LGETGVVGIGTHFGPPAGHAAHALPSQPHEVSVMPGWHLSFESQQPSGHELVSQTFVHWPSATEQNSPLPQVPSQREPHPSGAPHALPWQFGTHALQPALSQVSHLPLSQTWHVEPPGMVSPPHATP
jgi:hypothetical protein